MHPRGKSDENTLENTPEGSEQDPSELPVVARLMVEIRSDGSYTVARGAMEDAMSGQRVAIEASGATPLALALSLAKSFVKAPFMAGRAVRALLKK